MEVGDIWNRLFLVVDDEENLLLLLYEILSKEGYHVKTTTNAYEALDFVDQRDVRVAILDIRMYPVDGIALLAEVKSDLLQLR